MTDAGYTEFVRALFAKRNEAHEGALHATIGLASEAGELLDAVKKNWVYGKPLDQENIVEELGDVEWYAEALRQVIGASRDFTHALEMSEEEAKQADAVILFASKSPLIVFSCGLASITSQMACIASVDNVNGFIDDAELYARALARIDIILHGLYKELGVTRQEVLDANVAKLKKRYPAGYSDRAATVRADKNPALAAAELERAGYVL